jgi:hypothetical protein
LEYIAKLQKLHSSSSSPEKTDSMQKPLAVKLISQNMRTNLIAAKRLLEIADDEY